MYKPFLIASAVLGALAVAIGAFGAHALKNIVSITALTTFETGVRYHFYHVFALLATGVLYQSLPVKKLICAGCLFIAGIILFSGSLYLLTLLPENYKWVGAITPFGGLAFITGWLLLAFSFISRKTTP
jgi:uncharacterized membrane protein YgdD (TMEM256/DUF423 family)